MSDTLLRQWAMLRCIPRAPGKVDTSTIKDRLEREGFSVDVRTIQRDLKVLSSIFPLTSDERSKPFGWQWVGGEVMDIPGMDPQTALSFVMSEELLRRVLPGSSVTCLEPHFSNARNVLGSLSEGSFIAKWSEKIRILPRGLQLMPAEVDVEVADVVYEALLKDRRFSASYRPRGSGEVKEYEVNPLGLVVRDNVIYLIANLWEYDTVVQLVLHRFESAQLLDSERTVPSGFDLDSYVCDGGPGYPVEKGLLKVKLRFEGHVAKHLMETPLSDDQRVCEQDGLMIVEASVLDTQEFRWWLNGFGSKVEVLAPDALRGEFRENAERMFQAYSNAAESSQDEA